MNLGRLDEAKELLGRWQRKGSLNPYQGDVLYRIAFSRMMPQRWDALPANSQPMIFTGSNYRCSSHSLRETSEKLVR